MVNRTIIFRADSGPTIGMGHFIRMLALAEMLNEYFHCIFATKACNESQMSEINKVYHQIIDLPNDESHFQFFLNCLNGSEIVVLDNYYFTTHYQRAVKARGCKLVCIDDIHDKHYVADVVINHAPISATKFSQAAYTKLLLGFDYALLRQVFFNTEKRKEKFGFNHVLVCFGGSDFNNLTVKTLQSISKIESIDTITVIIGNAFRDAVELENIRNEIALTKQIKIFHNISAPELVGIINEVDFAIVPCSTILYEVISQKIPVITGFYIDNQIEIASNLKDNFAHILVIGDLNKIKIERHHIDQLKQQVLKSGTKTLISYNSKTLLQKEFHLLNLEYMITIRKARIEDMDIYFNWVNDPFTRSNSIHTEQINYQEHENWFQNKINQVDSILFIFEENMIPVGQVRFDKENDALIVDYSVDKNFRRKSFSKVIMKMAIEKLYSEEISARTKLLLAKVEENNVASFKVFKGLNFELAATEYIYNSKYFVFKKEIK
jgi:UDP-2,4-diacetamido-2,4,6-trideoxy-beta-L-altropyranose hydrolase